MKVNTDKLEKLLDRQMKSITMNLAIKGDVIEVTKTTVSFLQANEVPPVKGDDKSRTKTTGFPVWSTHTPHPDFEKSMRGLLDHALEALEMYLSGSKKDYTVVAVDIAGDLFMNQARVTMTIAKIVERSEKIVKLCKTPQITLSDGSKYDEWKDLQKKVEVVINEAWEYLKGKHLDDAVPLTFQMDIFDADQEKTKPEKAKRERKAQPPEPGVPGMMANPGVA